MKLNTSLCKRGWKILLWCPPFEKRDLTKISPVKSPIPLFAKKRKTDFIINYQSFLMLCLGCGELYPRTFLMRYWVEFSDVSCYFTAPFIYQIATSKPHLLSLTVANDIILAYYHNSWCQLTGDYYAGLDRCFSVGSGSGFRSACWCGNKLLSEPPAPDCWSC